MSACKINIGHDRDHIELSSWTPEEVERIVLEEASTWAGLSVIRIDSFAPAEREATTVVGLVADGADQLENFINELSLLLQQECISVLWHSNDGQHTGEFIGPEEDTWELNYGWDPKFFIDFDGLPIA